GNGEIITNNSDRLLPYLTNLNGNYTLENINITTNKINNGNLTLINSNINSRIINYGDLKLINCSLSNNIIQRNPQNTNLDYSSLIYNNNTLYMENCIISNNTLNSFNVIYGGNITIENCTFTNNTNITPYYTIWRNVIQANNINMNNCYFEDNAMCIGFGNLILTNSIFKNNKYIHLDTSVNNEMCNPSGIVLSGGNLYVDNSTFEDNGLISRLNTNQEGGFGGVILAYNATVINSVFKNNVANTSTTWTFPTGSGAALYITHGQIINNTFENNTAYNPSTITIPSIGQMFYGYMDIQGLINGCGADIYATGTVNIQNNTFKDSKASNAAGSIYAIQTLENTQIKITDNTFNNIVSSLDTIVVENPNDYYKTVIENNIYENTTIDDELTLNIPEKTYEGEPITITGTYTIKNESFYDKNLIDKVKFNVYLNGVLNQTVDKLEFNITPTAGNMILLVQPTISKTKKSAVLKSTTLTNIIITPENYDQYIFDGLLIGVSKDTKIIFNGTFTNKGEIVIDTNDIIIDGNNSTFTNAQFILDNENITIQNININNTENSYAIINAKDNNIITANTITLISNNILTSAIKNTASNTIISNNIIIQEAPATDIDFSSGQGVAGTQAILLLGGNNNIVEKNNINIKATSTSTYGTLEAITNNNGATNTLITQNTINISGANFNYAIDSLNDVENITITKNTILVSDERYCDGIQIGNGANNIIITENNITCICINTTVLESEGAISYGVIATSMGSAESNNITITNNNINLTGTANYAIELYKVNNTQIHNNNITVTGPFSLGIAYSYAPNGNATGNVIIIDGDSTTPINYITEEIKPENTGVRVQNGTLNIKLQNNTIKTTDIGGQDSTIHTDESTVIIKNNKLTSTQGYGRDTIIAPTDANIEENTINTTTTITTTDIKALIKTPVTLTATVTDEFGENINTGYVTFTDTDGNIIATANITDGTATTTATFKTATEGTITATYTPTSTGLSTSTAEAIISIQEPITQLNIEEVELTAGETVTLKATVTDQLGNPINGGKITFKVNGKTVKDANGKVVYAKVIDGVATAEYTVPDNMAAQEVTITATYTGTSKFNKETATLTTTVTPKELTLTTSDVTATAGQTVTLTATLSDNTINTGKIVFKINGKTVKDANGKVIYAKVVNGQVSVEYTLPENMKTGSYNLTAAYISSNNRIEETKTLTIEKS
ncbi:MAG: Ig-like domain repeat protein, partial [Methanosphaera sp.]|nr:Ig-like domain repeat protein [Methanosphaera sp.]